MLRSIDTRPEYIRVVVHEVPATHWSTGDTTLAEMRATAIAMEEATPTSAKELS